MRLRSLTVFAVFAIVVPAAAACGSDDAFVPTTRGGGERNAPAVPTAPPSTAAAPIASPSGPPKGIVELFETRVLTTCALNGGVCHNSSTYPDMRDVSAFELLVNLPCGTNVDTAFPNVCEPAGDRLTATGGIDVEIVRVAWDAATATATVDVSADVPSGAVPSFEIDRTLPSGQKFVALSATDAAGAIATSSAPRKVSISLGGASPSAQTFFQPTLPLREDRVHEADVNHDGVPGWSMGWKEILPGDPWRSYVVARLWDTSVNAELMPRQCRAWNDEATRALGCFVEGLETDESGAVTNFFDDIDYAHCTFQVPAPGRCGSGITPLEIFDQQCSTCHGATDPPEGLDLRAQSFAASLVGKPSREQPQKLLVDPGHPESSYLMLKVQGDPSITGVQMPKGGALAPAQIEALRAWIAAGAM
jgi:hypothetical protein